VWKSLIRTFGILGNLHKFNMNQCCAGEKRNPGKSGPGKPEGAIKRRKQENAWANNEWMTQTYKHTAHTYIHSQLWEGVKGLCLNKSIGKPAPTRKLSWGKWRKIAVRHRKAGNNFQSQRKFMQMRWGIPNACVMPANFKCFWLDGNSCPKEAYKITQLHEIKSITKWAM